MQHVNGPTVGLYVDAANVQYNGGWGMQYDLLREFACREGGSPLRLNAYVTYDRTRGNDDYAYRNGAERFHNVLRENGFKVIIKEVMRYRDEEGNTVTKANADMDIAVDMLLQAGSLQRLVLVSGDGDFVRVVRAVQDKGCRVEVLSFNNTSSALRQEADYYISGFLIPNLVPIPNGDGLPAWGEVGSRVRGVCQHYKNEGYGFVRYLTRCDRGLWVTDSRLPHSPYRSAYFSAQDLAEGLTSAQMSRPGNVFEFTLVESTEREGQLQAVNLTAV